MASSPGKKACVAAEKSGYRGHMGGLFHKEFAIGEKKIIITKNLDSCVLLPEKEREKEKQI